MDIRTFYKWKRKKPIMNKVDALISCVRLMERNYANAWVARIYGQNDVDYYRSEAKRMKERVRLMYWLIEMEVGK